MRTKPTLLLLLISFSIQSQNYKFGKVSKEELKESFNPKDSFANATVLYKSENIRFKLIKGKGFVQIREVHERIKIYNKEGYNWATKRIRLYDESNSKSEILKNLKEYTYNLIDGKIEDSKLKKDGVLKKKPINIGKLYFSPMLFFASRENPFKQDTRSFLIDFPYPFSDRYMINIKIPEGYAIESLPQSEKLAFNDAGDFTYLARENGNFLQLTVLLNMKTSIILAQDYEVFKDFYS